LIPRHLAHPALIMGLTRISNLALSVLMVPVMIHGLGTEGFASWAILLSAAAIFTQLEGGLPTAFVRSAGVAADGSGMLMDRFLWAALACVAMIYAATFPLVAATAGLTTSWVRLQSGTVLSAAGMLLLVYVAVALRALLQYGTHALLSAQAFPRVATISFLQSFLSNLAASAAAVLTRRVDVCVLAFWTAQLAVLLGGCILASRTIPMKGPQGVDSALMRPLFGYALHVQFSDLAHTVNLQFGKFVVAAFVGLPAVALYEVANRAVVALRSVPGSAMEAMLPRAARDFATSSDLGATYRHMNAVVALGVVFFCFIPMSIAPLTMYAWVGEMGYVSRWIFVTLAAGMAANLLALPAVVLCQAAGRPQLQAMAAASSIVINVALTFELVRSYRLMGAALGAALALTLSAATLLTAIHRAFGLSLRKTLTDVALRLCIPAAVCLLCGLLVERSFASFIRPLAIPARYALTVRAEVAVLAACAYVGCAVLVVAGESVRIGRFPSLIKPFDHLTFGPAAPTP
jgi:O-antigen/teichoic acid export membrane protein